jgi:hypothetical protein
MLRLRPQPFVPFAVGSADKQPRDGVRSTPASDDQPDRADLAKLSLEDLMRVEVASVARRNKPL